MPLSLDYEPPSALPPCRRGLLTTTHERHLDMLNLIDGLPEGALDWRPAPNAAALAGLVLHILDVEEYLGRLAAGEAAEWTGENGSRMGQTAPVSVLAAEIERVDALLKAGLEQAEQAWLEILLPGETRTVGQALVEDLDHCAMHYGHMQITRHLWEAAHPDFESTYVHWR